jgi:WD40 repeat protein
MNSFFAQIGVHLVTSARHLTLVVVSSMIFGAATSLWLHSAFAQGRPDIQWMRGGNAGPQGEPYFLADGQRFVTASYGTIQYWRASDGVLVKTVYAFSSITLTGLALSPNKQILAALGHPTGSTPLVKLYNASDGSFLREILLSSNLSEYVAFSPDNESLAINSGGNRVIQLWRVSDGALLRTYDSAAPHQTNPTITGRPAFSPDGQYISGTISGGSALCIVSVSDGHLIKRYDSSSTGAGILYAFSPDGQYFLASRNNGARLAVWRLSDPCIFTNCVPIATLVDDAVVNNLRFSPDGSMFAIGGGTEHPPIHTVNRIWRTSDWSLVRSYDGNNIVSRTAAIAFTPDGTGLLSHSYNMKLWSIADGSLIRDLDGHSAIVNAVAYSPDGQTVASGTNTSSPGIALPGVYLWRASDGLLLRTLDFGENTLSGGVTSLAFSPDGLTVAVTGSLFPSGSEIKKVKLFSTATGGLIRTIDFVGNTGIAFSPDGQTIATYHSSATTGLYRVSDGVLVRTISNLLPDALAFSPDGQRITDGRTVHQVSNGIFLFGIGGAPSNPSGVSYSPDGQLIATVAGNKVILCTAANGTRVRELIGHTAPVNAAVFSPDNSALLSTGQDATIRIWRVSDGALLQVYDEEIGFPGNLVSGGTVFSSDGQFFLYGRRIDATIIKARNPLVSPPPTTTFTTPAGSNVVVDTGDVRVTFDSVLQLGYTTVLAIEPTSTNLILPVDHTIPNDLSGYEITTTAGTPPSSNVDVCIKLPNSMDPLRFGKLHILHGEGANLVDRTISSDFSAKQVCSRTTTLSPFLISEFTPSDAIVPTAYPTQSLAPNAAGWNTDDVTISWNWSDDVGGSGIDSSHCITASVSSAEEGIITLNATCKDLAGNSGSASYTVKIDRTRPTISAAAITLPNSNGWYNGDVTVHFTCTDNLSGIPIATCPADETLSVEGMMVAASVQAVTDIAGNVSRFSNVVTVQIDKTKPTLNPTVNPNPVHLNFAAIATSGAVDALSGLASQSCDQPVTTSVGFASVTCIASDRAGNNASAEAPFIVNYNFAGFFQPVDDLPTVNILTAASAVAIKFSLGGNQGLGIFFTGYPASAMIPCSTSDQSGVVEETVNAGGSSLTYNATTGQYSYVWKTEKAWKGTCRMLAVKFIDGTSRFAKFQFR